MWLLINIGIKFNHVSISGFLSSSIPTRHIFPFQTIVHFFTPYCPVSPIATIAFHTLNYMCVRISKCDLLGSNLIDNRQKAKGAQEKTLRPIYETAACPLVGETQRALKYHTRSILVRRYHWWIDIHDWVVSVRIICIVYLQNMIPLGVLYSVTDWL